MELLNLLKALTNISYWKDPKNITLIFNNKPIKIQFLIDEIEKFGFLSGIQYERYAFNKDGIYGINEIFLSKYPILYFLYSSIKNPNVQHNSIVVMNNIKQPMDITNIPPLRFAVMSFK